MGIGTPYRKRRTPVESLLPKVIYMHYLDNTEGIPGNRPYIKYTTNKTNLARYTAKASSTGRMSISMGSPSHQIPELGPPLEHRRRQGFVLWVARHEAVELAPLHVRNH